MTDVRGNHLGLTLATGALAAVNYGQDHGLILSVFTLQAEEADGLFWVQAVAAALADRLEVGLLYRRRTGWWQGVRTTRLFSALEMGVDVWRFTRVKTIKWCNHLTPDSQRYQKVLCSAHISTASPPVWLTAYVSSQSWYMSFTTGWGTMCTWSARLEPPGLTTTLNQLRL